MKDNEPEAQHYFYLFAQQETQPLSVEVADQGGSLVPAPPQAPPPRRY